MSLANEPAFPGFNFTDGRGPCRMNERSGEFENFVTGMTVRTWLAGQCIIGLYACPNLTRDDGTTNDVYTSQSLAKMAVEQADALIAELEKKQ